MDRVQLGPSHGFHVIAKTPRSSAATMVLGPGERTGGPDNRHQADQWMFVLAGSGRAVVEGREVELAEGDLLMIEAGEQHEVRNVGEEPFETVNIYAPPAY